MDAESQRWAVGSTLLVAVLLWPLVAGRDSFPLSNYPMFSGERDTHAKIAHVIGRRADGSGAPLSPWMLGSPEIMQAVQIARNAVKKPERAADLCAAVAERVAQNAEAREFVAIEVRTDEFDAVAYWSGDRAPRSSRIHARCEVDAGTGSRSRSRSRSRSPR